MASRLALLLPLALLAASSCVGDDRERLVVYSPHGQELLSAYEAAFEAAHPEVDVVWLDMGAQDAYDRLRTERQNPQASLWWGAPQTLFARAADEGLLTPYTPSWAAAVPADARDAQGRWFGTFLTPEVIAYNAGALDSTAAPRDWDDLLDPRWRGRVVIRSPLASGTMRVIFGAMILRQPSEEEGFRWLARLDENTADYPADPTQLYLKLARGEGDVTLWNLPDIVLQAEDNGYPFGWRIPASGTPVVVDAIAVTEGAPNRARAERFYEFVTSPEALVDQARRFHRIPARTDVPADSLPGWMRGLDLRPMPLDWRRLAEHEATWMQRWDEQIRGRGAAYLRGS
jgi:iron(III) transport system substrate-binding protein